jgi:hypothetical protein
LTKPLQSALRKSGVDRLSHVPTYADLHRDRNELFDALYRKIRRQLAPRHFFDCFYGVLADKADTVYAIIDATSMAQTLHKF